MAQNKNTLIIGGVSLLLVGTFAFFVIKSIKKKSSQQLGEKPSAPEKKKTQIIIEDTISAGIGKPNAQWNLSQAPSLGLGEVIKTWLGNIANKPITTRTNLGQAPITPNEVKPIDFKSELSKSLHQGYKG
jgi:uncharacterized protein YidB (DUF937 family)